MIYSVPKRPRSNRSLTFASLTSFIQGNIWAVRESKTTGRQNQNQQQPIHRHLYHHQEQSRHSPASIGCSSRTLNY